MADGPNAAQAERWGGPAGRHWVEHEAAYDHQLEAYGVALLDAADLGPTDQVLDVGCGTGTTALAAAARASRVVGLDVSAPMVERARSRGTACPNLQFVVGDAQTEMFEAPFDAIISRFGLMFFADPGAAFANLRRAAVPAGRLVAVCWQSLDRNDWMRVPAEAMARVVPVGDLAAPGLPGPFSLGSAEELTALLAGSGWDDITLESLTIPVPVGGGASLDDAVAHVGGGSLGRAALTGVSTDVQRAALAAVRSALAPFATSDGVRLPGAAWLVRAVPRVSAGSRRR